MNNILLVFLNELENVDEFNDIIDKFAENNYIMYLLDNIKDDEYFSIDSLPDLVEFYISQHENVNKIVVLSNSRDLIFSWYRCYNSVVDDFIYFIDEDDKNYFIPADRHFSFYYNLYEFNSIDNETVQGKIYLSNIEDKIALPVCYEDKYFDSFSNFDFSYKYGKVSLNKKYIFNGLEYIFNSNQKGWENIKIDKFNKRVAFIKGQSQYDVLRIGTDYRAEFYKKLGFDVDILDLLSPNVIQNINNVMSKKCDFIYSSNCIGIDIGLGDGRNLYDALRIPFIGRLGDHPVNQLTRIVSSPRKTLFTCIDTENVEYFKKYFPDKNITLMNACGYPAVNYKRKQFIDRKIDILFAGTLKNPDEIKKSWESLDKNTRLIIKELSEIAIQNKYLIDIDDEISKMFLKYNIDNQDLEYRALIHSQVERFVRVYKRYKLVKIIGESDLEVVCIGNVQEYSKLNKSGKLIIRDKVSYQSLLEIMNDSKMVLNMTGHLYNGVTERILSAMINGAAVVTEDDRFTKEHFIDGHNIILYDYDTVIEKIKYYLGNLNELEKIAFNGQIEAINKYDYKIMLCKIMRYINFF